MTSHWAPLTRRDYRAYLSPDPRAAHAAPVGDNDRPGPGLAGGDRGRGGRNTP